MMPDYRKMYGVLFHEVSRAIEILQRAQCETEEFYLKAPEDIVEIHGIQNGEVKKR